MKFRAVGMLSFAILATALRAEPVYDIREIPSPANRGAVGATLTRSPTGAVWLSWVESANDQTQTLRLASFDAAEKKWGEPRTVHRGSDLAATTSDSPTLVLSPNGHATALWTDGKGRAFFRRSVDSGKIWSAPLPLTIESNTVGKISAVALADGHVLAAWLDGRSSKSGGAAPQLFSRLVGESGRDHLVDANVSESPLALTAFPDGTALLGYRSRAPDGGRDILVASFRDGQWDPRTTSTHDGWKTADAVLSGPRLASDGPRVSKVWFTAADGQPRVLAATSPDAGGIYTRAERADLGHPLGGIDTLLLRDGSQLVTWLERTSGANGQPGAGGALYLRRYGRNGSISPPVLLAALTDANVADSPRLALVKNSDTTPAQFIATSRRAGENPSLVTLLVTLPDEASLAEADRDCDCGRNREDLHGDAVRGRILAASGERETVQLRHGAIPGLLRAGEREFKLAPETLRTFTPPVEILGRIEQRDGDWWLFDVRLLGQPQR